jgi:hypothetical protein
MKQPKELSVNLLFSLDTLFLYPFIGGKARLGGDGGRRNINN